MMLCLGYDFSLLPTERCWDRYLLFVLFWFFSHRDSQAFPKDWRFFLLHFHISLFSEHLLLLSYWLDKERWKKHLINFLFSLKNIILLLMQSLFCFSLIHCFQKIFNHFFFFGLSTQSQGIKTNTKSTTLKNKNNNKKNPQKHSERHCFRLICRLSTHLCYAKDLCFVNSWQHWLVLLVNNTTRTSSVLLPLSYFYYQLWLMEAFASSWYAIVTSAWHIWSH